MENVEKLEKEYGDLIYMASGLKYNHQQSLRNELLTKAHYIREEINEIKKSLNSQNNKRIRYI